MKHNLHLSDGQLGTVLLSIPVGLMIAMPFTGKLLNRFSSRNTMLVGSLLLSVLLVLIGLCASMWQLVAVLFFFGSARNLFNLSTNTQAVAVQGLYKKSIMATFHGIWSLGSFAGAGVGLLMIYYNVIPLYHFISVSVVMITAILCFITHTLHLVPVRQPKKKFLSLPDKHLIKFALICFVSMACENTMYDWSAIYFQKQVFNDKTVAAASFVIYLVAMTAGRFYGDKLVTRYGIQTILKFSGAFIFAGLTLAVALPFIITAAAGYIMVGLGVSCVVPMIFSLAGKSKTMSSATALASISTVGYLGFVIIPPFVGFVAQTSSLRLAFGIIAMLGALIIYLVSTLNKPAEPVIDNS